MISDGGLHKRADNTVFLLPMAEWLLYSAIISTGEARVPGGLIVFGRNSILPHHPPLGQRTVNKHKLLTSLMARPQCCYLAKEAKRPSHSTNMLTSSNKVKYIVAATALKASNLNSAVRDLFCKFGCKNRHQSID